jgi:sulfoxide reductase heme-binding subunit YedZ
LAPVFFAHHSSGDTPAPVDQSGLAIAVARHVRLLHIFYVTLHFGTFLWLDHFFDIGEMVQDIIKRPFILVGFLNLLLLLPLAITSTNGWLKRLGGTRSTQLHQLLYLVAPLAILLYCWMKEGKHDSQQPILYGTILAVLLVLRIVWFLQQRKAQKQ